MNSALLKQRIKESELKTSAIAERCGITREALYYRMQRGDFRASEITAICKVLNLDKKERDHIFFDD